MKHATADELLERAKTAAGGCSDQDLAKHLGISKQAIADARTRKSVPASWIPKLALLFSVSTDWLFFGIGPMRLNETPIYLTTEQPTLSQGKPCEHCGKLEKRLEALEEERCALTEERRTLGTENRQLNLENRQLWKENGDLRERCARLEGQGALDACLPFKKLPNTQSNDRANS